MKKEIEEYIKYLREHNYTKETIKKRITGLNRLYDFIKEANITNYNDINASEIEKFKMYYKNKGYKNSTIKLNLKAFRIFMKYLHQKKIISMNPFNEIKKEEFSYNDYPTDIKKYYDLYIKTKKINNTAKSTLRNIKSTLKLFFKYLIENNILKIEDLTRYDLKAFIEYLIDLKDKNGNKIYKADSINRNIGRIKSFLLWLSDRGIKKGVASSLINLKYSESITRNILNRKEITKLFLVDVKSLYEFMIKTIFVCLYSTGLRVNELLKININDIDFKNRIILIYDSKEKKDRYVHIGEVALDYIKIFIEYVRDKIGYDSKKSNKLFISNIEGKLLREATVNKYLKDFSIKAGIKKNISSHCFRHSYGSHILENGADIKIISDLLGHGKLSTTERYTRLSPENLREVIENHHPREGDKIAWN